MNNIFIKNINKNIVSKHVSANLFFLGFIFDENSGWNH